jgi:uncharacterized protein GlcG (DUF336 family)
MNKMIFGAMIVALPMVTFAAKPLPEAVKTESLFVSVPQLSLSAANKIADATIAACRVKGINIAVTVVDRFGIPMAMQRDTLAGSLPVQISMKKAYTAVAFNSKTSALTKQASSGLAQADGTLFLAGGAPIEVGGKVFGAVGVSGAADGMDDEGCALAGIEAVSADLEMQ